MQEELALQQRMRKKREGDIYRSALGLLWCLFGRPYEWICTIAVILFTIFVALKLDEVCLNINTTTNINLNLGYYY